MKKTIRIPIFINSLPNQNFSSFSFKTSCLPPSLLLLKEQALNYPERINRRAINSSSIISKPEDVAASKGSAMALKEVNELKGSKMIIPLYFLLFFDIKKENAPDEKSK